MNNCINNSWYIHVHEGKGELSEAFLIFHLHECASTYAYNSEALGPQISMGPWDPIFWGPLCENGPPSNWMGYWQIRVMIVVKKQLFSCLHSLTITTNWILE